jgi:hypothetical protein
MKLVITLLGLLGTLTAQVVCYPVDSSGSLDFSSPHTEKIFSIESGRYLKSYLVTDHPTRPVRCFEHFGGTIGLNNGQIVHSFWVELKPREQWVSAFSCSASRSEEPLFRFSQRIVKRSAHEGERQPLSIPEFCQSADQ